LKLSITSLLVCETGLTACQKPLSKRLVSGLVPAIIALPSAQSKHGIDVFALPMHADAFETGLHDPHIGTFHTATANRPVLLSKLWVVHHGLALLQIVDFLSKILDLWMTFEQLKHFLQNVLRSVMLELMQLLFPPFGRKLGACLTNQSRNVA